MFDINSKYKLDSDIPLISDNLKIIHFDEVPILYTGTNEYEDRVVGSFCGENDEQEVFRYFHLIVKNYDYLRFIKRKISYRDLILCNKKIFIIDKDINDTVIDTYHFPVVEIPIDYLPRIGVYCPNVEFVFGSEFTFSLKGKLANIHEALIGEVSSYMEKDTNKHDFRYKPKPDIIPFEVRIWDIKCNGKEIDL